MIHDLQISEGLWIWRCHLFQYILQFDTNILRLQLPYDHQNLNCMEVSFRSSPGLMQLNIGVLQLLQQELNWELRSMGL